MRSACWIPLVVCAALFAACSSSEQTKPGPPPPCPACMSAGALMVDPAASSSGSGGATGAGGGGQGGGEMVTASGDVVTVNDLSFDSTIPYTKPGTVYVYANGTSGQEISQPYNGATFSLDNVTTGENWFQVVPMDTTDDVFPTFSVQNVGASSLTLPLISRTVLGVIAEGANLALLPLDAQIVIRVSRGGVPLKGIKADSMNGLGAGEIVYDVGPASYGTQGDVTGERGVIVLLNMTSTSITLTDTATMTTYHPVVRPDPGTATLLDLEL